MVPEKAGLLRNHSIPLFFDQDKWLVIPVRLIASITIKTNNKISTSIIYYRKCSGNITNMYNNDNITDESVI